MNQPAPIRLSINALGGQGGGVLADWIVATADACGWVVQATSVPGVAQRTGATVYYLELCPPDSEGRAPVQALMPVPGDVDIVIAAELMEAGRAIARGLVTPDRTTLIASTHRIFAIAEKSAMGDGTMSPAKVLEACRTASRRLVLADYQSLAERNGSVISAALFGALAGAGALPFPKEAFEESVRRGGVGTATSLRAFAAAYDSASRPPPDEDRSPVTQPARRLPELQARMNETLPEAIWPVATLGIERLVDFQDVDYAALYLDRLAAFADAERQLAPSTDWTLTRETARYLALWMAFEDVIRVADLKTRGSRRARVLTEARARPEQVVHVVEYLHPRVEELCDILPPWLAKRLIGSERARRLLAQLLERDRTVSTTRLGGFLLLYGLSRLRPFRRGTLRYQYEQERIVAWLSTALNASRTNGALALEIIRCQRLVKGYGETHARGIRNFSAIMRKIPTLVDRLDSAAVVRTLREAALKDDEGRAFAAALRTIDQPNVPEAA